MAKSNGTQYLYGPGGEVLAETNGSGRILREFVYFGGRRIARVGAGNVVVRFTNDSCSGCGGGTPVGGGDRNLFVNSISAGATVIPANDSSVTYTVPSCNGYYSGVGTLACSGDLVSDHYATATAQTITVNAYGSPDYNIYPHMQVLVNGIVLGEWDVTGAYGPIRARLNPMSGKDDGDYFHGQSNGHGYTHGCLCYGTDTRFADYMWNNMPHAPLPAAIDVPVTPPQQ